MGGMLIDQSRDARPESRDASEVVTLTRVGKGDRSRAYDPSHDIPAL
jgi:hypothetical protein